MCQLGDIVEIYSPQVGYPKYHLCLAPDGDGDAARFLFLNSEGGYEDDYAVADVRIACLPPSDTGQSVISCSAIVRFNQRQRGIFKAQVKGHIEKDVAAELIEHVKQCSVLPRADRLFILSALEAYCAA